MVFWVVTMCIDVVQYWCFGGRKHGSPKASSLTTKRIYFL